MKKLLLLHGFAGSPDLFQCLRLEAEAEIYAPVLSGHTGQESSPHPPQATPPQATSFDDEVRRLEGWCRARGFAGGHLLGYSLGARLGWALLLRAGSLFSGATLLGAHPGMRDPAERAARARADDARAQRLLDLGVEEFMSEWEQERLFDSQRGPISARPDVASRLRQQALIRRSHRAEGLASALSALSTGRMPVLSARATELKMPVDLAAGRLDTKFTRLLEPVAAALPQGRFHSLAGAGHNAVIEQPAVVRQLLAPHLTSD